MPVLSADQAYRIWAPDYDKETAVSFLEDRLVSAMSPPLSGLRLLDVGCGTGRRMRKSGATWATGVDICPEMLAADRRGVPLPPGHRLIEGDVRTLPVAGGAFDIIWCRLVLGHLREVRGAYGELARASKAGARVLVSDFHPAAWAAGHRRTFRTADGVHEIEHYVHRREDHVAAAEPAGLTLCEWREAAIAPEVRHFYETAGRGALFEQHLGLPVVLAIAFIRED
jgi:malonyl-CoA O-methyltransferase